MTSGLPTTTFAGEVNGSFSLSPALRSPEKTVFPVFWSVISSHTSAEGLKTTMNPPAAVVAVETPTPAVESTRVVVLEVLIVEVVVADRVVVVRTLAVVVVRTLRSSRSGRSMR